VDDSHVAVRVDHLSKRFVIRHETSLWQRVRNLGRRNSEAFLALDDVTIDIPRGKTVGLIGPNGSGKSTLLKAIGGIIGPTSGSVLSRGRIAALLELGAGFHPDLTGRENVFVNAAILGLTRQQTEARFDDIVEFSEIERFIDTQVKFYSSGMYMRLAFAVAVHVDPDILIVDEVLAVGDEPFQRKCFGRIREFQRAGKTIVLVTHSLDQVAEFCDQAVVLEAGRVVFTGDAGDAIQRLRADFALVRRHHADTRTPQTTMAEPHIQSVRLLDSSGEDVRNLPTGAALTMDITLNVPHPVDDWIIGMGIETALGQVVFGTNTERMRVPELVLEGVCTMRFDLGALHLGAGEYFVHASYGTKSLGEIYRIAQAASFSVAADPTHVGVIATEVTATVVDATPAG
jgi:ABC-2 type transport system ATP-binding protein